VDGISFDEAIHQAGFAYKKHPDQIRSDLKAFIELHVEQGNVLEVEAKTIGIVQHIVGQRRFQVTVQGEANHAGTTPLGYRKAAMYAASRMISTIIHLAENEGDPLVATVGQLLLEPNTVNVVPGKVTFTIDMRHTEKEALIAFTRIAEDKLHVLAADIGVA